MWYSGLLFHSSVLGNYHPFISSENVSTYLLEVFCCCCFGFVWFWGSTWHAQGSLLAVFRGLVRCQGSNPGWPYTRQINALVLCFLVSCFYVYDEFRVFSSVICQCIHCLSLIWYVHCLCLIFVHTTGFCATLVMLRNYSWHCLWDWMLRWGIKSCLPTLRAGTFTSVGSIWLLIYLVGAGMIVQW